MTAVRLIVLGVVAVPVFTGWFPFPAGTAVLPGVSSEAVLAAVAALAGVAVTCGRGFLANTLTVTALVVVPVVYGGGTVSWLLALCGGAAPGQAGALHGAHYVRLALNMLGVIPLALAVVAAVPFARLEQRLLRNGRGIPAGEKYLLMFVRVFHHIVDFVIPNILEVMREEGFPGAVSPSGGHPDGRPGARRPWRRLTAGLVQVGVSGICAAVRFIPLWAREIDDLPGRSTKHKRSQT